MKNFEVSDPREVKAIFFLKVFFAIIFIVLTLIGNVFSQVTFDELTITEGKGAMTSGFDVVISLSKPNGVIFGAQANNERSNLRFGKRWGNFTALATAGAFKNVPWIGPIVTYNYKFIDLFGWSGVGMATDDQFTEPGWKLTYFFSYGEIGLNLGKNRFAYSLLSFGTRDIDHFLIYRRTIPLDKKHAFFAEATYYVSKDIPLFVVGYKYTLPKRGIIRSYDL